MRGLQTHVDRELLAINVQADRLQLHPYLVAIGSAFIQSPPGSEEHQLLREAWIRAGERYGFDVVTRMELLTEIGCQLPEPS